MRRARCRLMACSRHTRLRLAGWSRGLLSRGNQHRERVADLAGADGDARVAQPGLGQHRLELVVPEAERAIAELDPDPLLAGAAARSSTSTRPPGTVIRAASATARAGFGGVVQRLRQQRDVDRRVLDRQLLELAALPDDVRTRRRRAERPRARSSTPSSDRPRSPATPSATPRSSDSLRRSRDRPRSAAAAAGRARATTPPSCGRAPAAGRRGCRRRGCRSSPCAGAALPAAAPRRPAPPGRRPAAANCSCSAAQTGAMAVLGERRRQAVVGVAGVLLLGRRGRRP